MSIAFIPIDNRPVCYTLAQQIAAIDSDLELMLPPRTLLGDLKKIADIESILRWLENLENIDKVIVSLDTIAHGGLIPSRRSQDTFEQIKERIDRFSDIVSKKHAKVYAFSSIMRISNNNVNEEEKEYWNLYGEKIFEYSYETHKNAPKTVHAADIPSEILQDWLLTRKRNFEINQYYLELARTKDIFETLVFSKDDCAKYGFNVAEAHSLQSQIDEMNVAALIKTGADEIPLSLLSRAVSECTNLKVAPIFTQPNYVDRISKYEDVSVFDSVKGQIELAGAQISEADDADIILLVNNFKEEQGELVMGVDVEGNSLSFELPEKPYIVADILNANGADNCFVKNLMEKEIDFDKFLGYAGWNTTGNTLGSALCCGFVRYLAKNLDINAFKKVQAVRFLDDWAYQANIRKKLKSYLSKISVPDLEKLINPFEEKVQEYLKTNYQKITYNYPWDRFFETEVIINNYDL